MIPISEAHYKVKVVKSPIGFKDFRWVAQTDNDIGISSYMPESNPNDFHKSPEEAIQSFKDWAALNGITKYEINGQKYYDIVNEKSVQFKG